MAYVLPAGSTSPFLVDVGFVEACAVLKDMQEAYGESTTNDPIPLPIVTQDVLQDLILFHTGSALNTFPPPRLLVLVSAADYLHYERFINAAVDEIAHLICYSDPEHVQELFGVPPLTSEQLETIARENPYLVEN